MAQLVLGVAGAAVGFVASGFNPYGAQAGFMIGSAIGAALTPKPHQHQEGPRLTDLKVQSSTYGAPIPTPYGMYRFSGEVIMQDTIQEHATESSESAGGKGGGGTTVTTTSYTYTCSFAVLICEGEIDGIRRIWADGKLLWDTSTAPAWTAASFTVYKGSEDQMPDPTMEAIFGAGLVPAHRGYALVVFQDLDLTKFGNRLPQFSFEIARGNVSLEADPPDYLAPIAHVPSYALRYTAIDPDTGWIWIAEPTNYGDDRLHVTVVADNPDIGIIDEFHIPKPSLSSVSGLSVGGGKAYAMMKPWPVLVSVYATRMPWIQEFTAGEANPDGTVKTHPAVGAPPTAWGSPTVYKKSKLVGGSYVVYATEPAPPSVEMDSGGDWYNFKSLPSDETWALATPYGSPGSYDTPIDPVDIRYVGGYVWVGYSFTNITWAHFAKFKDGAMVDTVSLDFGMGYPNCIGGDDRYVGYVGTLYGGDDFVIIDATTMTPRKITGFAFDGLSTNYYSYDYRRQKFVGACQTGGPSFVIRTCDAKTGEVAEVTIDVPTATPQPSRIVFNCCYSGALDRYIIGAQNGGVFHDMPTTVYLVDPNSLTVDAYFTYETSDSPLMMGQLLEPKLTPGGRVYVISFDPDHVKRIYLGNMDASMPLWKIVRDISEKCGLGSGDIDVTQLTDEVMGYAVTSVMSGRSAIEPLMTVFSFDAVDSDGKVKFVKRGKPPVLSIDSQDMLPDSTS